MKEAVTAAIVTLGAVLSAQSATQPQNAGSPALATITGLVMDDSSNLPVPNASVRSVATSLTVVLTDEEGRFSLQVPPGRQTVVANKTSFAGEEVIAAGGGAPVVIRLQRGASISGRVANEFGDPSVGARVRVEDLSTPVCLSDIRARTRLTLCTAQRACAGRASRNLHGTRPSRCRVAERRTTRRNRSTGSSPRRTASSRSRRRPQTAPLPRTAGAVRALVGAPVATRSTWRSLPAPESASTKSLNKLAKEG
jgi:hypothetical protein